MWFIEPKRRWHDRNRFFEISLNAMGPCPGRPLLHLMFDHSQVQDLGPGGPETSRFLYIPGPHDDV